MIIINDIELYKDFNHSTLTQGCPSIYLIFDFVTELLMIDHLVPMEGSHDVTMWLITFEVNPLPFAMDFKGS